MKQILATNRIRRNFFSETGQQGECFQIYPPKIHIRTTPFFEQKLHREHINHYARVAQKPFFFRKTERNILRHSGIMMNIGNRFEKLKD